MFSADLSWTDNTTEKVGQRRQRRANKREGSIPSSTSGSKKDGKKSSHRDKSSPGSITKTISFSSVKDSMRRPSTATSAPHRNPSATIPELVGPHTDFKDPAAQPDYTYAAKLGSRLPSGAILESPRQPFAPACLTIPLRTTHAQHLSTWEGHRGVEAPSQSQHRAWSVKTQVEAEDICQSYQQVKDEILALQNPDAILPHPSAEYASADSAAPFHEYIEACPASPGPRRIGRYESLPHVDDYHFVQIREETPRTKYALPVSCIESKLRLPSVFQNSPWSANSDFDTQATRERNDPAAKVSQWSAPESWDIVKSDVQIRRILDSESSNDDLRDEGRHSMFIGSHFQRFVRRMESAGPRIIFERLKEEWDASGDRAMTDELQLEKHLWALTAIQLPSMDRFVKQGYSALPAHPLPPLTPKRRRKILELDGHLGMRSWTSCEVVLTWIIGEVYQLSAIYPNSRIYHLTRTARSSSIPLPSQAVQHEISVGSPANSVVSMPTATLNGILPLPYANSSMHHVRSTRLPTLIAGTQLPALLSECHRVLKPGGVLELRLMDATPDRRSMGPLLANWLEDRLLLRLEADFKCTRPIALVPRWVREAGFVPVPMYSSKDMDGHDLSARGQDYGITKRLRLPAVASTPSTDQREVVGQVGVLVSRALWRDAWGSYVCDHHDETWWWESPDVVDECRAYDTTFDVGTLIVMKAVVTQ